MERFIFHHPKAYRQLLMAGMVGMLLSGIITTTGIDEAARGLASKLSSGRPAGEGRTVTPVADAVAQGNRAALATMKTLPGTDGSATTPSTPAAVATRISIGTGDAQSLGRSMNAVMFGDQYWPALQALWTRESGWNPAARNPRSGACGIPQALPCSKILDMSPQGQIQWGLSYIRSRYGNPANAWRFWQAHHWY